MPLLGGEAGRVLGRGALAQAAVRALGVVLLPPGLDTLLRFGERGEAGVIAEVYAAEGMQVPAGARDEQEAKLSGVLARLRTLTLRAPVTGVVVTPRLANRWDAGFRAAWSWCVSTPPIGSSCG